MEALVAHHVVYSASCYHCKQRGGLRRKGGRDTDSSWTDLLCWKCKSTYEIKSKKDAEALEKVFHRNELPGGSFRLSCQQVARPWQAVRGARDSHTQRP